MNKNARVLVAVVVAALAIFAMLKFMPQSDEKLIAKQFTQIADNLDKFGQESLLKIATRAEKLKGLLADPCSFDAKQIDEIGMLNGEHSASEAAKNLIGLREQCARLKLRFENMEIKVASKPVAYVNVDAVISGSAKSGEALNERLKLRCTLLKENGKWLFSRCEIEFSDYE